MAEVMSAEVISAYEQVTRTRLEALEQRFEEHERSQSVQFQEIKEDLKEIKHELSKRLPLWATTILTICGGLVGSLLTVALRR